MPRRENNILCYKCDSYIPSGWGIRYRRPRTRPQQWFKGVLFTGECHSCAKTRRVIARGIKYKRNVDNFIEKKA